MGDFEEPEWALPNFGTWNLLDLVVPGGGDIPFTLSELLAGDGVGCSGGSELRNDAKSRMSDCVLLG